MVVGRPHFHFLKHRPSNTHAHGAPPCSCSGTGQKLRRTQSGCLPLTQGPKGPATVTGPPTWSTGSPAASSARSLSASPCAAASKKVGRSSPPSVGLYAGELGEESPAAEANSAGQMNKPSELSESEPSEQDGISGASNFSSASSSAPPAAASCWGVLCCGPTMCLQQAGGAQRAALLPARLCPAEAHTSRTCPALQGFQPPGSSAVHHNGLRFTTAAVIELSSSLNRVALLVPIPGPTPKSPAPKAPPPAPTPGALIQGDGSIDRHVVASFEQDLDLVLLRQRGRERRGFELTREASLGASARSLFLAGGAPCQTLPNSQVGAQRREIAQSASRKLAGGVHAVQRAPSTASAPPAPPRPASPGPPTCSNVLMAEARCSMVISGSASSTSLSEMPWWGKAGHRVLCVAWQEEARRRALGAARRCRC